MSAVVAVSFWSSPVAQMMLAALVGAAVFALAGCCSARGASEEGP